MACYSWSFIFFSKMMFYFLKKIWFMRHLTPFFKKWYARKTMCARLFKIMFQCKWLTFAAESSTVRKIEICFKPIFQPITYFKGQCIANLILLKKVMWESRSMNVCKNFTFKRLGLEIEGSSAYYVINLVLFQGIYWRWLIYLRQKFV